MPLFRTVHTNDEVRLEPLSLPPFEHQLITLRDHQMPTSRLLFETRYPNRRWRGPKNRRITNRPSRLKVRRGKRYTVNFTRI
jgi:hypothetical protein